MHLIISILRFNLLLLLYKQYPSYLCRVNSTSKRDFNIICQQHLSDIAQPVIALADFDETPQQIDLFLSYIPSFRSFTIIRYIQPSHISITVKYT